MNPLSFLREELIRQIALLDMIWSHNLKTRVLYNVSKVLSEVRSVLLSRLYRHILGIKLTQLRLFFVRLMDAIKAVVFVALNCLSVLILVFS